MATQVGGLNQQPLTVLVVDDDEGVVQVLERLFSRLGHQVDTAYSGSAALDRLTARPYDVCLIDKNLPDISGVLIAQRARSFCPQSVIVLLTGYASLGSAAELIGIADDYITKPFEIDQLRDTVQSLLLRRATLVGLKTAESPAYGTRQVFVLVSAQDDAAVLAEALRPLPVVFEVGSTLPMLAPSMLVMAATLASFSVRKAIWNWQTHSRLRLVMLVDPTSIGDTIAAVSLGASWRINRPYELAQAREVLIDALEL